MIRNFGDAFFKHTATHNAQKALIPLEKIFSEKPLNNPEIQFNPLPCRNGSPVRFELIFYLADEMMPFDTLACFMNKVQATKRYGDKDQSPEMRQKLKKGSTCLLTIW